eukprot:3768730-Prymnesium_polylepis.1
MVANGPPLASPDFAAPLLACSPARAGRLPPRRPSFHSTRSSRVDPDHRWACLAPCSSCSCSSCSSCRGGEASVVSVALGVVEADQPAAVVPDA